MTMFAKSIAALALGATAVVSAAPAQAQSYRVHRDRGVDAGTAIVAGIAGLALGAALTSGSRSRDRAYDRGYDPRYDGYRGDVYSNGYDQRGYDPYRRGYDGYAYDPGYGDRYARDCTIQRSFDRYSGRVTTYRVCR